MNILIREEQLRSIINASEAYNNLMSIESLVDGKRGVAFITLKNEPPKIVKKIYELVNENSLKVLYVNGNQNDAYIVYRQGFENEAKELMEISQKYGGYLSAFASEEDSRRIGQLLSYHPQDIEDYIVHNKKLRANLEKKK